MKFVLTFFRKREIKEAVLGEYEKRLFCINLRTSSLRGNIR